MRPEGPRRRHPDLLEQADAEVRRFIGDGAYDRRLVYDQVAGGGTEDVVVVVAPRRCAAPDKNAEGAWSQRNSDLERIREIGRRAWLKESGYRQQARDTLCQPMLCQMVMFVDRRNGWAAA